MTNISTFVHICGNIGHYTHDVNKCSHLKCNIWQHLRAVSDGSRKCRSWLYHSLLCKNNQHYRDNPACHAQLCVTSSHHGVQKELWGHSCSVRGMSGKAGWKPGAERRGVCWKDDLETVLLSGWRAGRETCSTASQLDLAPPPHPLPTMTQWLSGVYNPVKKHALSCMGKNIDTKTS